MATEKDKGYQLRGLGQTRHAPLGTVRKAWASGTTSDETMERFWVFQCTCWQP